MRENIDASFGLVYSQRLLLALVDAGLTRDESYRLVQRNALRAWDEQVDFQRPLVADDAELGVPRRPRRRLRRRERSSPHVDTVFERLRALVATRREGLHV